jgi:hypothetical protein
MKREINLSPEQVKAILLEAKKNSFRDYLLIRTLTVGDFRVGEVVGSAARRWIPDHYDSVINPRTGKPRQIGMPPFHWEPCEPNLRGLQIQDLHEDGVWVEGKGWRKKKNPAPPKLIPLPLELVKELREYAGTRKTGRIFEVSESRVEQMTRFYAKRAGVIDWKLVHPHRFRHFTTTQVARKFGVLAARDIARHANISTTNRYIAELPENERRKIIAEQEDLISV